MNTARLREIAITLDALDAELANDPEAVQAESDFDLIESGYYLTRIASGARQAAERLKADAVRRMDEAAADVLAHDYVKATRTWKRNYASADVEGLSRALPQQDVDGFLEFVPEQQQVIPARWRIKSAVALSNYIGRLGSSARGQKLRALLNAQRTLDRVSFELSELDGWEETLAQVTAKEAVPS